MVYNITLNNISVIYWWSKLEYPEKNTDLMLVTLTVIGADCIGSCKTNSIQSWPWQPPLKERPEYMKSMLI